jgi:hypothetical protein
MDCRRLRISSGLRVSRRRGRGSGRPEMLVRMRFMPRGAGRGSTAGDVDGDALIRSSSPALPSSSAFRLRPVIADEGEKTAKGFKSVADMELSC